MNTILVCYHYGINSMFSFIFSMDKGISNMLSYNLSLADVSGNVFYKPGGCSIHFKYALYYSNDFSLL